MGSISEKLQSQAVPASEARGPWFIIEAGALDNELILCVPDPANLAQAKATHPALVAYLLREVETLYNHRENIELLQTVHRIKKKFGGHVRSDAGA